MIPFTWWGPCSRPLDPEKRLEGHGLHASEHELGMTIELAYMPDAVDVPSGVTIRRMPTLDEITDVAGMLAGLSDPADEHVVAFFRRSQALVVENDCPMRFYVAYIDGEPGRSASFSWAATWPGSTWWRRARGFVVAVSVWR